MRLPEDFMRLVHLMCISKNLWEFYGYELAKMNPSRILCIHDLSPENPRLEIACETVIHHPDLAGKSDKEILQYFADFKQRTGVDLVTVART